MNLGSQLVFIGEDAVTTIDIAAGKALRCLLSEANLNIGFVSAQPLKPGLSQDIGGMRDPIRARDRITLTQVFDRSGTKSGPLVLLRRGLSWLLQ